MGHLRSYLQYAVVVFASLWFSRSSLARTSLPYCQDDRDFQHGSVVYKLRDTTFYSQTQLVAGIKRKYRCNRGYVLKGSSWSTCLAAGRWSNDPPTCEPKGCPSLRKKENNLAYVGYTREKGIDGRYPHGTSGQVFCDAGKILVAGNGFTECSAGEWVPLIPLCYDIDVVAQGSEDYCPIPYIWAGQLSSTDVTEGHVSNGFQVDFECLPFAERATPSPITCMSGRWEPEEPRCIPKHCTLPPLTRGLRIVNAPLGAITPHSQNLTLECSSAYILQGPPQITCWYGDWAGNIPTCDHPKTDPPPTSPRPTTIPTTVVTTTEEPRDLLPRIPGEDYSQCGKAGDIGQKLRGRVVGGYEANEAAWPWQAAIYWQRADGSWFFFCAGTVINREWIISAGHCFGYDEDITRLQVKLGLTDRIRDQGTPREQVFSINGLYLPKEHDFIDFDYDIALLHLSQPAVLGPYVRPICLPPEITSPDANLERLVTINSFGMVIGWGHSKPVAVNSSQYTIYEDILQQLQIPVRPRQACVNSLRDVGEDETQFTINMFCAGYNRKPLDTCFGDSGGPLMRHIFHPVVGRDGIQRRQKRWVQVGIVSAGKGCAVEGQFAFYTHVPRLVNWVYSVIRSNHTHTGTEIVQL
ncbi:coagulation factor X-like [Lytechinus pictus]|uniref:coagulation factor X-like n=1 Tax=Lytechinus pictus TaxID=7653 RepID=UPI0030BA18B2